jgi:hypothetical protein
MPVKRRISKVRNVKITAQAVELYRRAKAGEDVVLELHRVLNLRPWHPFVFQVEPDAYPEPDGDFHTSLTWQQSKPFIAAIRRQLEAALAAAERTPHDVV